jgi:hypothetical protein
MPLALLQLSHLVSHLTRFTLALLVDACKLKMSVLTNLPGCVSPILVENDHLSPKVLSTLGSAYLGVEDLVYSHAPILIMCIAHLVEQVEPLRSLATLSPRIGGSSRVPRWMKTLNT